MHPIVKLAKQAIETYIKKGCAIELPVELMPEMKEKAGVFVCIKIQGELRGCIGTFMPSCENVAKEIIKNSICAATQDPRFLCVQPGELDALEYSVDVLSAPEEVKGLKELNPKKYGVIVSKGQRKGLLLPDLEGVDTVEEQLRIVKMKAGLSPDDEDVKVFRFEVKRYR
ncbi:MAG: AmmeMemoRadiSam system protein A [Nitrospirae bacterium]|nr:MAG: AmmeMemoRadiSam system protein A [Nitrospirota bacterium]